MRYIQDHLTSFGLLRWGATDGNESQHKSLKRAYGNTNHSPNTLSIQLLKNGYTDMDTDCDLQDIPNNDDRNSPHVRSQSVIIPQVMLALLTSSPAVDPSLHALTKVYISSIHRTSRWCGQQCRT